MATSSDRLPLGAVRTASGEVVVPASRRADGSERKPIRIRAGYVPQDEVPKYKTVAQRRREQEAAERQPKAAPSDVEAALQSLSLEAELKPQRSSESSSTTTTATANADAAPPAAAATPTDSKQRDAERKQQLSKLNRLLKDIAKLEARADQTPLSAQQQRKLERKAALQAERSEIIAELNGATITSATASAADGDSRSQATNATKAATPAKKKFVVIEM